MRRILLAGAPTGCWTNLGDEAILAGMAAPLRTAWPEAELTVVSSNPAGFLDRHGCEAVPFRDVSALAEAVAASDLVLLGGGSIFYDYWACDPGATLTPRHAATSLLAGTALLAAAYQRPLMVYGAGVEPLSSAAGRLLAGAVFELADVICLRDRGSLAALEAFDLEGVTATVTGDAALGVALPPAPLLDLPRPWLGVGLRQWDPGVDLERWRAAIAAALDRFLESHSGSAVLVPCHRAVRWPQTDDTGAGEAVRVRMARGDRVHAVDVDLPWAERAALLAGCDLVLAMRFHAAFFALAGGVPAVALAYDRKVTNLMAEYGLEDFTVALESVRGEVLARLLERAWDERATLGPRARRRCAELRERERGSVARARELLSRPRERRTGGRNVWELVERLTEDPSGRSTAVMEALTRLRGSVGRPRGFAARCPGPTLPPDRASAVTGERMERPAGRRVAILTNRLLDRDTGAPCIGGAERYALELGRLLRDLGLEPTFFQREGVWSEGDYFGFRVVALPRGKHFSEFEPGVAEAFFDRTRDFDHVLILMPNYASGPLRDDALVVHHGVWWDHDLYREGFAIRTPEWYRHLERVFARPQRVVSADNNSINVVRALFPAAAAHMTLIPSFVDTERFHPPAERAASTPLVLIPRRVDVLRGARLMGPILEFLPRGCRVRWIGDGPPALVAELRRLAARDPRFEQRAATFDEMPALYRSADITVIPTLGHEAQSLSCLEAMASGCAVVATRVGGLPELIRDEVDGLLCDPTAESIAGAIRGLLHDPELRRRLGAAARTMAERHSLDRWRDRWTELLAELGWTSQPARRTQGCDATSDVASGAGTARRSRVVARRGGLDDLYDIVCFSIINWEFRWQRPQQMMALWARRGRRVFYLRITDFLPADDKLIAVKPLAENVWEVRIALPKGFSFYSGEHPAGFATVGLEALRALREEFEIKRAAAVVQFASWTPLACAARKAFGWPLVYDCMDDWSAFPGLCECVPLLAWEEELLSTADRVVVSSRTIQERWANRRTDLILAPNAADFAFFQKAEGEDPLPGVEGPVAGFFGAIAEWFDRDLMASVAKARPEVTFVLVGGVHRVSVSELEKLPNVRFEGWQPYEKMPLYLRRFDVCLVPFEVSPATNGMDVVKLYEYLSQGKPVVTTPIREILIYSALLYLAEDERSFVHQLDRALNENDPALCARRIELARQNTWDERLDRIEAEIGKMTNAGCRMTKEARMLK
jgi:glycosyltransferase involved in cell wall biosynthesis/polysaccharide pyruvyl transferase WcaK-like protein